MAERGMIPKLGWIGLGNMGLAMALNIQRYIAQRPSNTTLYYHNRTSSRGLPLQDIGGTSCASIEEVVRNANTIFISMSDDAAVRSVIDFVLEFQDLQGKVIVDTSTIHPATTKEMHGRLTARGANFVAAPVFGNTPVAQRGQLLIAIGGNANTVESVMPYLEGVLARAVIRVGEDVALAGLLKTTGNFITASMAETIAESLVFAEKVGLPTSVVDALIRENYGSYAHSISDKLIHGVYAPAKGERPRSDLRLAIKDVSHGVECAKEAGTKLKIGELTLEHLLRAREMAEVRPLDSSAVYGIIREDAGLDFETDFVKSRDAEHQL